MHSSTNFCAIAKSTDSEGKPRRGWEAVKIKMETKRISTIHHKGFEILYIDLSQAQREDGAIVLAELLAELRLRPENSVRILMNVTGAIHDARQSNEWKAQRIFLSSRVLKAGIYGFSPMVRMAWAGYRMAAKLMGEENLDKLGHAFESHEKALDYLAS